MSGNLQTEIMVIRQSGLLLSHWYLPQHREAVAPGADGVEHFCQAGWRAGARPNPYFDPGWYLAQNPDIAEAGVNPLLHFLVFGVAELRNPSAAFDIRFYLNRYGAVIGGANPLLHYLANQESGVFLPARPEHEGRVPEAVRKATRASVHFEEFRPAPANAKRKAKLLAYYLPQFHQLAENDAWWGKGFTDWTNLGRAMPRFVGHLQPRVPRDLGYYSLSDPNTLRKQIELAKGAGLHGFVYYTYWFNRHRLLEKPLQQLLDDPSLDFPFCAMWANENWTRRWDGLEREVLIAQEYLESDDAALIGFYAGLFADPRYIRIDGRPLFMIYRVALIPDAPARIVKWRRMFRELHGEEPIIIMAQSLGEFAPKPYGLDGAIEFPPHKLSQETERLEGLDLLDPDFSATVHDYEAIAETSLRLEADYPLIKTIVPGWDNDPRREGKGLVLHNTNPGKYQDWLQKLVEHTEEHRFFGERVICVNAWNEWAEGAFLEPDLHFGAAYLNATARAICGHGLVDFAAGVLLVGHDAQPHGAQLLLLHLARKLRRQWGIEVHVLLLGPGPLLGPYYETARVTVASDKAMICNMLDKCHAAGIHTAIVNSAASARIVPWLERRGIRSTMLVHEMPQLLKEYNLEIQARLGGGAARNLVFSSDYLRDKFCAAVDLQAENAVILPQGNYQNIVFDAAARARVRRELGIEDEGFMVLGAGFGHLRKGFDLFIQLARKVLARRADVTFIWVGDIQFLLKTYLGPEMEQLTATGNFRHIPFTGRVAEYFSAADVFALTSREDPYPTVVMEALACGVPCVAFDETGGIPELLRREKAGRVAKLGDIDDFLVEMSSLLDHEKLSRLRPRLMEMAAEKFDFAAYTEKLLTLAQPGLRGVSVAVLNYNYAKYLRGRLQSVFEQSYPVREVLFLDDASSDDSLAVAQGVAEAAGREMRIIANAKNSSSVFAQWQRAAEAASSEFIWLCEADDLAEPPFLARLVEAMDAAGSPVMAFSDSRAIDAAGKQVMPSYQSYYFESGVKELSTSGIWEGKAFARRMLSVRNLIPNVSAVLWRREALLKALAAVPDIAKWKLAGDWRLYLALLAGQGGSLAYIAEPLNVHRRHGGGVTQKLDAAAHVAEIGRMHALAAKAFKLDAPARRAQVEYLQRIETQLTENKANPGKAVAPQRKV